MRHFYFRPNETDFHKWCREYVLRAMRDVQMYESQNGAYFFIVSQDEYHEALRIRRQYEVLVASLSHPQRILLDKLIHGQDYDFRNIINVMNYRETLCRWKEICFPKGKPQLKTIDMQFFGIILREQRMKCGLSAAHVSALLQIAPATLYAYENGTRPVKLNILYGMSQLYDVSIDELIRRHFL